MRYLITLILVLGIAALLAPPSSGDLPAWNNGTNGTINVGEVLSSMNTVVQDGTNLVVNFSTGQYQLVTATNDLFFIASNIVAGASILIDVSSGTTNRNLAFNLGTTWMSSQPTVLSSNHVLWVSITSTSSTTNGFRVNASQSFP